MSKKVKFRLCEICGEAFDKNLRSSHLESENLTCSTKCQIEYNIKHEKVAKRVLILFSIILLILILTPIFLLILNLGYYD